MRLIDPLRRDLRYAARLLVQSPGLSLGIILTLGLCIGANTAVFSLVDGVLLRPLPYPEVDRAGQLVLHTRLQGVEGLQQGHTSHRWEVVRDQVTSLELAPYGGGWTGVNLATSDHVEHVERQRVGAGFFRVLGVPPAIGREFTRDEDRTGGPALVVLSDGLWHRVFAGDPSVLGQSVMLGGEPHEVIGVMPAGFRSDVAADLWTPLRPSTTGEGEGTNYSIVTRLRPGVSWAQAEAELAAIDSSALGFQGPPETTVWLGLVPLHEARTADMRSPLSILLAAVALVLLIGCVNIASFLLARGARRTQEIATRLAVGATRGAIMRQLMIESLVLALAGGGVGLLVGHLALDGLKALGATYLVNWPSIALDSRVVAATAGVAVLSSLLFGLLPAWQVSRVDVRRSLIEGGSRSVAGTRHAPRRVLLVSEVALGVVLLIGAGLAVRTLAHLSSLSPGFDGANVLMGQVSLEDARYSTSDRMNRLFDESLRRIEDLAGVEAAAVALHAPYERWLNLGFGLPDAPQDQGGVVTNVNYVTPEYFRALRIPLLQGRLFETSESSATEPVAIVTRAFSELYFPDLDTLGRHIDIAGGTRRIVGVVGDTQQQAGWGSYGPVAPIPAVYIPAAQVPDGMLFVHTWFAPTWIVRAASAPERLSVEMQRAVAAVDPQLPFSIFRTVAELRVTVLAEERFRAILLAVFAGLALTLVALGIAGLIAHTVTERRREIGIRLALGATPAHAVRIAALPGVALTLLGLAVGGGLAWAAQPALQHLVWGVPTADPATLAGVALVLLAVAAAASVVPSLRILRLDPAETLREE